MKKGHVYSATLLSFRYYDGLCFGKVNVEIADAPSEEHTIILGQQADCPLPTMLQLKGIGVKLNITYNGTIKKNDVEYSRFNRVEYQV